jgi:hypothetical protein
MERPVDDPPVIEVEQPHTGERHRISRTPCGEQWLVYMVTCGSGEFLALGWFDNEDTATDGMYAAFYAVQRVLR